MADIIYRANLFHKSKACRGQSEASGLYNQVFAYVIMHKTKNL